MRALAALVTLAFVLTGCGTSTAMEHYGHQSGPGKQRTYFIAADQVEWDYAPDGKNDITGQPFTDEEKVFVEHRPDRIGSKYLKCIYRAYTDATFTTLAPRPAADAYMGNLGPTIRAEVGDTVDVHFKNNCSFGNSIHVHGLKYDKASEGATYSDGASDADHAGGNVAPGASYEYRYTVPATAGPGPMDGSSAMWMYHSHAEEAADVYAGLTGFIVVTAKGKAKADGSPNDVDREVFALFEVSDENKSRLTAENIRRYTTAPVNPDDADFQESNMMHGINGYVYGNGPVIEVNKGQRVRWYLMGMGTEVDLHTPHWHGNTVVANGMRTDVVNLLPATMVTADMQPDNVGTWLFHCHVGDHIAAGMLARYRVV